MSSLHNQPDVEDIVSAFEAAQNQPWSNFSDKVGGIPIKDCKKKDIFKSENPIELTDEDISVFGLVPRLEKLSLVSCNKCSMIVKNDCIHHHYNHRHNNPENDLFSVAQFIIPNVKTNKHKRPKLNVRKLPEKKIIDGVNIDPIVQGIKSEFDQVEFERISELNRATEQQGNIIQYDDESTSVNLALHCTPGTSYFNELCTQSSVQYSNQNEVNDLMTDFNEDFTKSVNIVKELQNKKCVDDTDDSINKDTVHCITKVEFNEKRKRRIDSTNYINDDEEFFENNHPKKKYHLFPLKQNSREPSLHKTSKSCSDIMKNQNLDNVFTHYDLEVNEKVTDWDKNLKILLGNGKELKVINNKDDTDRNTSITTNPGSIINTDLKSFDSNDKRAHRLNLIEVLNNHDSENKSNSLLIKPHVLNITSNTCLDVMKNQSSNNIVTYDHLENFKKSDCDKNLNELLDDETKSKSNKHLNNIVRNEKIYPETNPEISPINQLDSSRKIKCTTDSSEFINIDKEYYENNQSSNNKYHHLLLKPHTSIASNSSSFMSNKSVDNITSLDAIVNEKITECNKDSNKLLNDGEKLPSNKSVNDNINENIVNYFTVSNEPLDKLSLNLNKRKFRKDFKDKNKLYSKNKYDYLPFEPSNCTSTIEYEEDEYKIDETNDNSKMFILSLPSNNEQKLKTFIPISKFMKNMGNQHSTDSVSSFHKHSVVEYKKLEDQMDEFNDTRTNINLSITSGSLDGEKLEKYIPINTHVNVMDDQCSSNSLTNFHKSSTVEHKEVKNKMDEIIVNSKIVYLPLPFRSSNDNKPKTFTSISEDVEAMNDQCSNDSVPSLHKPSTVKNEEVEDKTVQINPNSQIINIPLSPESKNDKKLKKCVPIEKSVKAMEVQSSNNSVLGFYKSSSVQHEKIKDEMDKINVNSSIIYLPLPSRSLNDEKSKKYFSIGEFVKAMDNQCTSDSVTNIHKVPSIKHERIEDKIDQINANSNNVSLLLPPRSLNDKKQKSFIPINKFIKTMHDEYFSDSDHSLHKSPSVKHEQLEDKIDEINSNSKNLCLSLPSRSLNDSKPYILNNEFVKTMDNECFNDSSHSFHKSSSAEHEDIKDKIDEINVNSNIIYFPLPPRSLSDKKQKVYIPIAKNLKSIDKQSSSDSVTSYHEPLTIEHEHVKDKVDKTNVDSKLLYLSLLPRSLSDNKPKIYVPLSKFVKATDGQHFNNSDTSFHTLSSIDHEEIDDKIDNSKMLFLPLSSGSLNDKKPKKYVLVRKFVKAMDEQNLNNSVTTFNKLFTASQNVKENIKMSSKYICPNNVSDNKSETQFYQLPSISMKSNTKIKNLSTNIYSKVLNNKNSDKIIFSNDHTMILPSNIEGETKFAQNKSAIVQNIKKPDGADINYNHSTTLQGFKNGSKSLPIKDVVDEYCCNNSFNQYYQGPNDYTLSQVLKPLSSVPKLLESDVGTSSDKEFGNKMHEILKNNYCTSSKSLSNEKEIKLKSIDAYLDIINNKYYDEAFASCQLSSSLVNKELRPLPLVDDSNFMIDKTLINYELLNNQAKTKLINKHSDVICNENSNTSTSSYDQSSVSSINIKERTTISFKDIFSDLSDENSDNVIKLQDNLMKNNKCTQTDGPINHINHKFVNPICRVDESIVESHDILDDKTKYSQTDLLFGYMNNDKTSKDLIDNYDQVYSNNEIEENSMNSYTSDISSNQISEYTANSFTFVSSNAKSTNNTIASTSIEEYELMDNNYSDNYSHRSQYTLSSPESNYDHYSNCSPHHLSSDNNRELENYDKTSYSSYTDRVVQNECYLNHKINESISDVDKYFQSYKDRLKKTTDEKLINGKNWKILPRDNEAKMRKNMKKRLESKVVDNKENYGLWDLTESLGYDRTYDFVMRPALRQSHFSDESE